MRTILLTPPANKRAATRILLGAGLRKSIEGLIHDLRADRVAVLYDESVEHIAREVQQGLPGSVAIGVRSGDASKSLAEVERIATAMLQAGCTRQSVLVNVGGGMATDLGGLVAGVFMRGIPCVHVPTTTLAMVDAAIGGKNGVNLGATKNILGVIAHPTAVIIDTELLKSLPATVLAEGLVEVVKIAAIADAQFFSWLEQHIAKVIAKDLAACEECIANAVALKARIVEQDERDELVRLHLNYGHTVGHAVEANSHFALSHGKAVSIGMVAESRMTGGHGLQRIEALLKKIDMPTELPKDVPSAVLWELMQHDKKNVGGQVRVAVPSALGSAEVRTITLADFASLFS
jgi:3-dehydroquinate synthase